MRVSGGKEKGVGESNAKRARFGLRTKLIGLLSAVLLALVAAFALWTYFAERARTESEMVEQSRVLVQEMDAVWEFISLNQNVINYSSDGSYDYKGLHCAIVGKSVAALFSRESDYSIRFTKLNPRNIANMPDELEAEALEVFESDPSVREFTAFSERDGEQVFRYISVMEVTENCLECHGEPAGEIDATGYPKEGWGLGDVAVPTKLYYENMRSTILTNVGYFLIVMVCMGAVIYLVVSRLVTRPLTNLSGGLARMEGDAAAQVTVDRPHAPYATAEIDELFERFNTMSTRLSALYADLESQVTDRTRQLSEANRELERQRSAVERANELLKQENRYKSDFLAIVSHELRTPLTSIIAFAELMEDSVPEDNDLAHRQLEEIGKNGRILLEMVDNVLETARIQAGSERLNLELVDVNDVVGMVEASNRSMALKRGIEFTTHVAADVPLLLSDWEKLRRVLVNLVSNAIKFTEEGGRVRVDVRCDAQGAGVLIEVSDNGIGIPPDKHALVFERFTQENMSTVRRYGGSGLGLSLVKDLVTMLGGTVTLESALGEGSTFTVWLPTRQDAGGADGQDNADR